jgi:hypothetical protein
MPADHPVGQRLFTDGITRTVFRFPEGQQYVLDGDGKPVPGVWIYQDDEDETPSPTLIVDGPCPPRLPG